jgi:ParB family transcriptional regulator, chromosome partitioning protein
MTNHNGFTGCDLPIVKLVPRSDRKILAKDYKRIEASLRAVGLIEPLLVFPLEDHYEIQDGRLRYRILLEMGVESVPCILVKEREAYTGNRMVNRLSPAEEMRMLRKSMEELDEKTIASALGMNNINGRLHEKLLKQLDPHAVKAFESGRISRQCAEELTHVKPERQVEILNLMESCKDESATFAKGLVLNTPPANSRSQMI